MTAVDTTHPGPKLQRRMEQRVVVDEDIGALVDDCDRGLRGHGGTPQGQAHKKRDV